MSEEKYGKYEFNEEENAYRDVINQMMNEKTQFLQSISSQHAECVKEKFWIQRHLQKA